MRILHELRPPLCDICGFVLRPPVAFFQDAIPKELRLAADRALAATDVLILVGTHCVVDPVLSLVEEAKRRGVILVEINTETTLVSATVDVRLRGTADDIFREIAEKMMLNMDLE
jgi:NAD-dependent deacetylase